MGLRKGAADEIAGLLSIAFSLPRHLGPALTGVRARVIRLTRAGAPRPRRRGTFLRALRGLWVLKSAIVRNAFGCWRGTPGKANVSLSFAVVISVCHSYRLVSCITRLSYKKDVQQMRAYAKTSVNGTKGARGAVATSGDSSHCAGATLAPTSDGRLRELDRTRISSSRRRGQGPFGARVARPAQHRLPMQVWYGRAVGIMGGIE